MMLAQLMGHWRRESAALGRGASKQSQVQHNSYASVARRSSHPKHPTTLSMESLLVRVAAEGPLSRENEQFRKPIQSQPYSIHHGQLQPAWAGRSQAPTSHSTPRPTKARH